jgi:hypothetical protein
MFKFNLLLLARLALIIPLKSSNLAYPYTKTCRREGSATGLCFYDDQQFWSWYWINLQSIHKFQTSEGATLCGSHEYFKREVCDELIGKDLHQTLGGITLSGLAQPVFHIKGREGIDQARGNHLASGF